MHLRIFLKLCLLGSILANCTHSALTKYSLYDPRKIRVQTLSLYNQRKESSFASIDWQGDWIFRRERLHLIGLELIKLKADLLLFQNTMNRNSYESDQGILSYSYLENYSWYASEPIFHKDTDESEHLAIVVSNPLKFSEIFIQDTLISGNNRLFLKNVKFDTESLLVANLELRDTLSFEELDKFILKIQTHLSDSKICENRLILSIYAEPENFDKIEKLAEIFHLKDTAKGFCNVEANCYTASSQNPLFQKIHGDAFSERVDFLFVSESALVQTAHINFTEASSSTPLSHFKKYGLDTLVPSSRFGWYAEIVMPQCP